MNMRTRLVLAACAALTLSACDNGPSAVQSRDRSEAAASPYEAVPRYAASARTDDAAGPSPGDARSRRRQATQAQADSDLGGGLSWAANSRHTAQDNAQYQFDKRAADFGVTDFKAFVSKADAFVAHPPQGVLKMERSNGDVLLYDPKSNVFAVADRSGAPRTIFKPSDGLAYWDAQKAREARRNDRAGDDGEKS